MIPEKDHVVVVTGGRRYTDVLTVNRTLDTLHREQKITLLVHGGALGADLLAHLWAEDRGVAVLRVKAEWGKMGKAAGPIRNQKMIDLSPDLVVAFPGKQGTSDCVRRAEQSGIRVLHVRNA